MLAGVAVLALVVADVFWTVFVPRGNPGPLTDLLYRSLWRAARELARLAPDRRRRHFLALAGPLLLPLTVVVWALLLVVGFALIYLPYVGGFDSPRSVSLAPTVLAIYFSGYSATTLGVGDVYPASGGLRLVSVLEAGMGFALFTVAITYLLSVYGALQRSTTLALEVSRYLTTRGSDPLETLVDMLESGQEEQLVSWFSTVTPRLVQAAQAQEQYPVLEYFHIPRDTHALPMAVAQLLEVLTTCLAVLDPHRHRLLVTCQATQFAFFTAAEHARSRAEKVAPSEHWDIEHAERVEHYDRVRGRLAAARVSLRNDPEACERYVDLRSRWDEASRRMVEHFAYPPSTPATSD